MPIRCKQCGNTKGEDFIFFPNGSIKCDICGNTIHSGNTKTKKQRRILKQKQGGKIKC